MSALLLTMQSQGLNRRSALVFVELNDLALVSSFSLGCVRCLAEAQTTTLLMPRSKPFKRARINLLSSLLWFGVQMAVIWVAIFLLF